MKETQQVDFAATIRKQQLRKTSFKTSNMCYDVIRDILTTCVAVCTEEDIERLAEKLREVLDMDVFKKI